MGRCQPRPHQSAGWVESAKTRPGEPLPQRRSWRRRTEPGPNEEDLLLREVPPAGVTPEVPRRPSSRSNTPCSAVWHMLTNREFYPRPGPDYFTRHDPAKTKARALKQLPAPGRVVITAECDRRGGRRAPPGRLPGGRSPRIPGGRRQPMPGHGPAKTGTQVRPLHRVWRHPSGARRVELAPFMVAVLQILAPPDIANRGHPVAGTIVNHEMAVTKSPNYLPRRSQ